MESNMDNISKSLEYNALMAAYRERKFTRNDIKSFVYKIFAMYERATCENVYLNEESFHDLVSEDVYVDFPDYKIRSRNEFKEWHRWIHDMLISDDHGIDKVDVEFLVNGKYQARFFVRWRGEFKDGRYVDVLVEQLWVMREETGKKLPVIERYIASVADNIKESTVA